MTIFQTGVWAAFFIILAAAIGVSILLLATLIIPKLLNKLTPNIDEEKEIARGNTAVAAYFGKVVGSLVIGISIIIGAALIGGILFTVL